MLINQYLPFKRINHSLVALFKILNWLLVYCWSLKILKNSHFNVMCAIN